MAQFVTIGKYIEPGGIQNRARGEKGNWGSSWFIVLVFVFVTYVDLSGRMLDH
ncbi:unnamed protein product [Laminaria digitata]